jgi:alpha-glucoside PTS system EIICB component
VTKRLQRLGGAMFIPAILFAFAGLMVGLSIVFQNEQIWGKMATTDHVWGQFWSIISSGAWTVFFQLPLLFSIALPITLAKKQQGRAALSALVTYLTFNYFLNQMLAVWGGFFGVDITAEVGAESGLAMIANIKTLDTGMLGALVISGIVTAIHNKYFDKELPELLAVFRGTPLVVAIAFFTMLPVAFLTAWIWPFVQSGIQGLQDFFIGSGYFGIWVYAFLQKILIPTGLHHFVYAPITYDSLVVPGGTSVYWATHLPEFQTSAKSLKEMYPIGFSLSGMGKVFGSIGVFAAFYFTAKPDRKKKVLGLMIPVTLTAVLTGITEPIDFTFLFVAPLLFGVFAVLDATLQTLAFSLGVVGDFGGGLINWIAMNWLPLGYYHWGVYVTQIVLGLIFSGIFFVVFVALIRKFDFKTPGREDEAETKLFTKNEYMEQKSGKNDPSVDLPEMSKDAAQAYNYLLLLGGKDNIDTVTNCATRLRLTVKDPSLVQNEANFKDVGAHGLVKNNNNVQIIVGLSVPYVREAFENIIYK